MARWSRLGISLGLIAVASILPGCTRTETKGTTEVRFSFWGNYLDLKMWRDIVREFEAENPDISIKPEYISGDYKKKIQLAMISGGAADVLLMDDEILPAYSVRGFLEDLSPYIERDREALRLDDMFPTAMESFRYQGVQSGLPWDGSSEVFFFNKDLFDAAGVPYPDRDWTCSDFRRIARELTRDLDGDGRPDQFGAMIEFTLNTVEGFVWSFGGDILNEDKTRFAMNTPEAIEAIQFLADMRCQDHVVPWSTEGETLFAEVQLLSGRVAMVKSGAYVALTLKGVKDAMRWGMAPVPIGPHGDRATRVTWDGLCISGTSAHKEEAWRFLMFVESEKVQAQIARAGRGLPVRVPDARKYFVDPKSGVDEALVIDAVYYGKLNPITPRFLEIFEAVRYEFAQVQLCNQSAAEAVSHLEPQVNAILQSELDQWGPPTE